MKRLLSFVLFIGKYSPIPHLCVKKTLGLDHMRSYTHLLYLDILEGNSYSDTQSSQLEFPVSVDHSAELFSKTSEMIPNGLNIPMDE